MKINFYTSIMFIFVIFDERSIFQLYNNFYNYLIEKLYIRILSIRFNPL